MKTSYPWPLDDRDIFGAAYQNRTDDGRLEIYSFAIKLMPLKVSNIRMLFLFPIINLNLLEASYITWSGHEESNLELELRRLLLSPFNYGQINLVANGWI